MATPRPNLDSASKWRCGFTFPVVLWVAALSWFPLFGCGGDECQVDTDCELSRVCLSGACEMPPRPDSGVDAGRDVPVVMMDVVGSDADADAAVVCTPTDPPREICDRVDNDCDETIDLPGCGDGLVGWYPLEDESGDVFDVSGFDRHGSVVGEVTRSALGRIGRGVRTNMAGGWITVPVAETPDALTVELWVMPTDCAAGRALFGSQHRLTISIDATTCAVRALLLVGGLTLHAPAEAQLTERVWNHLAVVWDGAALRTYIDGEERGAATAAPGTLSNWMDTNGVGNITPCDLCPLEIFRGRMDDVKIWDTSRDASEICADLGGTPQPGGCLPPPVDS